MRLILRQLLEGEDCQVFTAEVLFFLSYVCYFFNLMLECNSKIRSIWKSKFAKLIGWEIKTEYMVINVTIYNNKNYNFGSFNEKILILHY